MQEPAQDPASLQRLNDIVVPEATAWWPPAPGWYVLGGLLVVVGVIVLVAAARHWWKNRYRSAALRELSELRESFGQSTSAEPRQVIAGINRILKRTALANWPREQVAPLSSEPWIEFLKRAAPATTFSAEQADALVNVVWSSSISEQMTPSNMNALFDAAAVWIRKHHASDHEVASGPGKANG